MYIEAFVNQYDRSNTLIMYKQIKKKSLSVSTAPTWRPKIND